MENEEASEAVGESVMKAEADGHRHLCQSKQHFRKFFIFIRQPTLQRMTRMNADEKRLTSSKDANYSHYVKLFDVSEAEDKTQKSDKIALHNLWSEH